MVRGHVGRQGTPEYNPPCKRNNKAVLPNLHFTSMLMSAGGAFELVTDVNLS